MKRLKPKSIFCAIIPKMDTPPVPLPGETPDQTDIRLNKDVAAFSYVWIMSVIVFASRRNSKFAQFHSKQGMVLFFLSIPIWLIPVIGHFLTIFVVAGMLLGFINAAQGLYSDVPLAGRLSRGELKAKEVLDALTHLLSRLFNSLGKIFHRSPKTPASPTSPPASAGGNPPQSERSSAPRTSAFTPSAPPSQDLNPSKETQDLASLDNPANPPLP